VSVGFQTLPLPDTRLQSLCNMSSGMVRSLIEMGKNIGIKLALAAEWHWG
jgi:hypothetical protein